MDGATTWANRPNPQGTGFSRKQPDPTLRPLLVSCSGAPAPLRARAQPIPSPSRPLRISAVASKSSSTVNTATTVNPTGSVRSETQESFSEWISGAIEQGVKPEQALAVVGLGLMRGMASTGAELPLLELDAEAEGSATVSSLKGRLEAISLAVQTGAPLTTQEVTLLLGARPGTAVVRRAGITAQRLSRNVWQLSRAGEERTSASVGFSDGFRRRL